MRTAKVKGLNNVADASGVMCLVGPKDGKLNHGICSDIMYFVLNLVIRAFPDIEDEFGPVEENSSIHNTWHVYFTPHMWYCGINHYFLMVMCADGPCILDIPMKEYANHDGKTWYWSGNESPRLHMLESNHDLVRAWKITDKEATRITQEMKDWETGRMYRVELTKEGLWNVLLGKDPVYPIDPRQQDLDFERNTAHGFMLVNNVL